MDARVTVKGRIMGALRAEGGHPGEAPKKDVANGHRNRVVLLADWPMGEMDKQGS
jgi:hypothetical protein